jgi:hypothetical protein
MTTRADYPSFPLSTPYGDLKITWLDPEAQNDYNRMTGDYSSYRAQSYTPEYRAEGTLIVNGISIDFRGGYRWSDTDSGRKLVTAYNGGFHSSRTDRKEWDWRAGYAKKLHIIPDLIESFVTGRDDLALAARAVTLHNIALAAESDVTAAEKKLAAVRATAEEWKKRYRLFLRDHNLA